MDTNPEPRETIKNLVILGTTGGGKSSTVNTIMGCECATVGNKMTSCTTEITEYNCPKYNLRIIDCPGANDHRFGKENIIKVMKDLREIIFPPQGNSSYQVDAFLMVIKCSPRAQSLIDDIEKLKSMFGLSALRTVQFIFIFNNDISPNWDKPTDEEILEEIRSMTNVVTLMKEAQRGNPSIDWFTAWSNEKPGSNQIYELLGKISTLKPYTHETFLTARAEIGKSLREQKKKDDELFEKRFLEAREADRKALQKEYDERSERMMAEMRRNEQVHNETLQYYKDLCNEKKCKEVTDMFGGAISSLFGFLKQVFPPNNSTQDQEFEQQEEPHKFNFKFEKSIPKQNHQPKPEPPLIGSEFPIYSLPPYLQPVSLPFTSYHSKNSKLEDQIRKCIFDQKHGSF